MSINLLRNISNGIIAMEPTSAAGWFPTYLSIASGKPTSFSKDFAKNMRKLNSVSFVDVKLDCDGEEGDSEQETEFTGKIAILPFKEPVVKYAEECGPNGTEVWSRKLRALGNDPGIIGIICDTDSGGGCGDAVEEPSAAILEVLKKKPVIAYAGNGICASAALWIFSHCEEFYLNYHTSAVGSIGTYMQQLDREAAISGMYNGAKFETIYAPDSYDKNKGYREWKAGDKGKALIEETLKPFNDRFISVIKANRPNVKEEALHGNMYMRDEAIAVGLVDGIKTMQECIDRVVELANQRKNQNTQNQTQMLFGSKSNAEVLVSTAADKRTPEMMVSANADFATVGLMVSAIDTVVPVSEVTALKEEKTKLTSSLTAANGAIASVATLVGCKVSENGTITAEDGKETTIDQAVQARIESLQGEITTLKEKAGVAAGIDADEAEASESDAPLAEYYQTVGDRVNNRFS